MGTDRTNSSMFVNCLVFWSCSGGLKFGFWPKSHVRTSSRFVFDDFEKNWAHCLLIKFVNKSSFGLK